MTQDTLTPLQIATRRHRDAGALVAGNYGKTNGQFRGRSIGCLAHDLRPDWDSDDIADYGHALVAETYDYPEWLTRLQDDIFEELPADECNDWHVALPDAIAARTRDWSVVMHAVHAGILRISYRTAGSAASAVKAGIDLHERAARGESVGADEWNAARNAAWSAAWNAARRAAYQEIRDAVLHEVGQ